MALPWGRQMRAQRAARPGHSAWWFSDWRGTRLAPRPGAGRLHRARSDERVLERVWPDAHGSEILWQPTVYAVEPLNPL